MPNITCNRVLFAYSFSQVQPKSIKIFYGIKTDYYDLQFIKPMKIKGK